MNVTRSTNMTFVNGLRSSHICSLQQTQKFSKNIWPLIYDVIKFYIYSGSSHIALKSRVA